MAMHSLTQSLLGAVVAAEESDDIRRVCLEAQSFQCGDSVVAARDLRVRGRTVVRQGGCGYVVGPAASTGRVCVQFEQREDLSDNRLNCLPDELKHSLVGGLQVGARIYTARSLQASHGGEVPVGTLGTVVGPARSSGSPCRRLLVRLPVDSQGNFEAIACDPDDIESTIAGNFRRGNAVIATRDLRVGGQVVVREGVLGTVVGPSSSDAQSRVTVSFSYREDGSRNRLNCIVNEIRLYIAGGFDVNARVQLLKTIVGDDGRPLLAGTRGVVLGPPAEEPLERLLVRFDSSPPGGDPVDCEVRADHVTVVIAGGFRRGESVAAAKDLRVKGVVVVKQGVIGTVVGQSATDPSGRATVAFARREDDRCNNLNVVPAEIQRVPCTGGLVAGDRVAALRQLLVVPRGTHGVVIGPSCARSSRVAVRFNTTENGEEVVLHVEPEDLQVLNAVGEDVDDSGVELGGEIGEDMTEDPNRQAVAGGYNRGNSVTATRDLCVSGNIVVRQSVLGTVVGPSGHNPTGRITVAFSHREDGKTNNLNVVMSEIRGVEPRNVAKGELCAICLGDLLTEDDTMCHMPCGHVLHEACVRAYLNHQTASSSCAATAAPTSLVAPLKPAQCPVCRRDVLP